MRHRSRFWTASATAAGAAVLAVPALAAGPPPGVHPFAASTELAPVGDRAPASGSGRHLGTLGDAERRQASAKPPARPPFLPIIGKPDYGTGENGFGAARSGHVHAGQDVFAPAGTPLLAVADTVVSEVGSDGGQGNYVYLFDPKRERTYVYMHMIEPAQVRSGERVRAGERVGGVGCSGSCWGDHLHFEVREGRDPYADAVDPLAMMKEWERLQRPR